MDRSMETRTYKRALSTGNLQQVNQTMKSNRNYAINRDKALETKTAKCNYQNLTFEMKAGKNFVVKFSTAAYELAKSRILTLLQSRDISTNYTVLEQHGVELSNLKIDSCYKVYNRKNNNQPGNLLKFTINLFHTTNKMTVNGNRVDIFINEIFDSLCSEIQSKFKELNICNNTIQSQLTNLKDCSSTVILQDGKNNPQSMSLQPTTVKSNLESRGKTTSIPSILDATDICSTQTEDKNSQVICPKCENPVENEGIACDSCDNWYHYVCSNIKEDDLKHYEGSDFHCQQCNDDLLYSEQTNILDERNDNPSEGITSADLELPRSYIDQQIEEENKDNTTPKQIFDDLENQQAQNGITIINSSSIPKVIDQAKTFTSYSCARYYSFGRCT
ncbi:Hypothetical predicted protein [Mytilus galloprovincialis]|uniref:PHD-type domain-containing protein n=1 Tax=Mytilus galloprovincialis TaxID=29158 RepID=A0A8B6GGT0_MYTGA|nr:Hypothetical predicted protein [Mytilus galloprovincialis]